MCHIKTESGTTTKPRNNKKRKLHFLLVENQQSVKCGDYSGFDYCVHIKFEILLTRITSE